MFVIDLDQRGSSAGGEDLVESTIDTLNAELGGSLARPFVRTAGDELQGVMADPAGLPAIVRRVAREQTWWLGVGIGPVTAWGATANASRGPAFSNARQAVTRAKRRPWGAAVIGEGSAGTAVDDAIAVLLALLAPRSAEGWEAATLAAEGMSTAEISTRLAISQQAVRKRLTAARVRPQDHGERLLVWAAGLALAAVEAQ